MLLQANPSGTRHIEVSANHFETIRKYALLQDLIDSTGIIDEDVLDKLRFNIRSLIMAHESDCRDLLSLCFDVIYHRDMKAFGLQQLIQAYIHWTDEEMPE